MIIYLSQHGKAKTNDPEKHLSNEGIIETKKMLAFIKNKKIEVDSVIHSGKVRAEETAAIFLTGLASKNGLIQMNGLNPNDPVEHIRDFILEDKKDYMFAGHLPFMNRLCSLLLSGDENKNIVCFKNSCIVCLKKEDTVEYFTLNWMIYPELL